MNDFSQEYLINQYLIESTKKYLQKLRKKKMSDNYIMLNGKRVDLTEEQLEKLGLKVEKDCFNKKKEQQYYVINCKGFVQTEVDANGAGDNLLYKVANYCTDKSIMEQRALHETLSRLLWRFSMQNDGDKINWNTGSRKYIVTYNIKTGKFMVDYYSTAAGCVLKNLTPYFLTPEIAHRAIDEIVLPFIKEHPEFVW